MSDMQEVPEFLVARVIERLGADPNFDDMSEGQQTLCRQLVDYYLCRCKRPTIAIDEARWRRIDTAVINVTYELTSPDGELASLTFNRGRLDAARKSVIETAIQRAVSGKAAWAGKPRQRHKRNK